MSNLPSISKVRCSGDRRMEHSGPPWTIINDHELREMRAAVEVMAGTADHLCEQALEAVLQAEMEHSQPHLFEYMDANRDGKIDESEMLSYASFATTQGACNGFCKRTITVYCIVLARLGGAECCQCHYGWYAWLSLTTRGTLPQPHNQATY